MLNKHTGIDDRMADHEYKYTLDDKSNVLVPQQNNLTFPKSSCD
jgi:hypothetical protein